MRGSRGSGSTEIGRSGSPRGGSAAFWRSTGRRWRRCARSTGSSPGIATNINQIAHAANRTHDPDYRAFMAQRAALGRVLLETRAALQRILDLGARREYGLARL